MEPGTLFDEQQRALADVRRAQIVDELRRSPRGLGIAELARRLGLHANTVRWHLGVLADAGILASRREERTTPGRPRIVYTLSDRTDAGDGDSHRMLATILSAALNEVGDGPERAECAGHAWGRHLLRSPGAKSAGTTDAAGEVVELLAGHGFRPELVGDELRMHHCPYRDLAPGVVCAVHLGLIRGALDELGSDLEVDGLRPFVEPGLCIARLHER